jgi:hypothetical protein
MSSGAQSSKPLSLIVREVSSAITMARFISNGESWPKPKTAASFKASSALVRS